MELRETALSGSTATTSIISATGQRENTPTQRWLSLQPIYLVGDRRIFYIHTGSEICCCLHYLIFPFFFIFAPLYYLLCCQFCRCFKCKPTGLYGLMWTLRYIQTSKQPNKPNFLRSYPEKRSVFVYVYYSRQPTVKHWYPSSLRCCYSYCASKNSLVSLLGPGCNLGSRRGPAPIGLCPPCVEVMTPSLWGAFDLGCVCASAGPISGAWGGIKGAFRLGANDHN